MKKTVQNIPPDIVKNAQLKLDDIIKMLEPYLIKLTPPERHTLAEIGAESMEFLKMSYSLAVDYPGLFPGFTEAGIFKEEFFTAYSLWLIIVRVNHLRENIYDTEMVAGGLALDTARDFYETVKIAARHDIPGAKVVFEDLKFKSPPRKRKSHPEEIRLSPL